MNSIICKTLLAVSLFTGCVAVGQTQETTAAKKDKLTAQSLPAFFKEMGYKAESHTPAKGQPYCSFEVREKDGWNFVVQASITEGSLTLMCPLGEKLPDAKTLPPALLLSLLEANQTTAPCVFTFQGATGQLYMKLDVPSLTPTAKEVQGEMQMLFETVRQTHVLWKEENWQNGAAKAEPEPAKQMNLAKTVWKGKENLAGYGPLEFHFFAEGQVVMVDNDGQTQGTYAQQGQTLTLTFIINGEQIVYSGTCDGQTFRGNAENNSTIWNFSVKR